MRTKTPKDIDHEETITTYTETIVYNLFFLPDVNSGLSLLQKFPVF